MDRDEAIGRIRAGLRRRTALDWTVKGGRGTAWGWITIAAPPRRRVGYDYTSPEDRRVLAAALGLEAVHQQGISIPAGTDYYREYVDRAEGRLPSVRGTPYWD